MITHNIYFVVGGMRERGGKHGIFMSLNINFSLLCFYSARRAGRGVDRDEGKSRKNFFKKLIFISLFNNHFTKRQ